MDVVLLHNENAGDEDWPRKQLVKLVRAAGFKPAYFELDDALDNPRVLRQGKFVIVAGGDGSIRKVALKLLGTSIPIAPLPLGTANNIGRTLGLPVDPEDIVSGWAKPRHIPFDVGLARGRWGRRHFVEGIGVGLISRMIQVIEWIDDVSARGFKKVEHRLHYAACVGAALAGSMPPVKSCLVVDGREMAHDYLILEILNIQRAGPALELAPKASPSDGRLDIVAIRANQRNRLMAALKDRLAEVEAPRNLAVHRAHKVQFTTRERCELRIDDGNVTLPANATVDVTLEPGALEFVLPEK